MRYSETLLQHANAPRNNWRMVKPDAIGRSSLQGRAPRTTLFVRAAGGRIRKATFQTHGCGAVIAACSVLTELIRDKAVAECATLSEDDVAKALGGVPAEKWYCLTVAIGALRDAMAKLDGSREGED